MELRARRGYRTSFDIKDDVRLPTPLRERASKQNLNRHDSRSRLGERVMRPEKTKGGEIW
jgi:hypothetical protein